MKIVLLIILTSFIHPLYAQSNIAKKDMSMLLEDEKNSISIFQNNVSSVVNVSTLVNARSSWFDMDETQVPRGMGTGFVWDNNGHIVTNYHVIAEGDAFIVTFKDDTKQYKAKLVGGEPQKDIAVLKLEETPKNLFPIKTGESKSLMVGQKTLAIGNPFGLDHTLTTGTVSALDRKIEGFGGVSIQGTIQTDASINPGYSGGPLLDSQGRLIGINTMIYSRSGSSAGVGFAIPVDTVKQIVPQIIKYGKVIRPGLGIGILDPYMAYRFTGNKEGIVIKYVDPKGAAGKAGVQGISRDRNGRYFIGDILIGIDDSKIENYDDLYNTLDKYKVGDKVKLKLKRQGKEVFVTVTLSQV